MLAQILPWMIASEKYIADGIELIPVSDLDAAHEEFDDSEMDILRNVMSSYHRLQGGRVPGCTVVRLPGRGAFDDVTDEERADARALVELACGASLARRSFFGASDYSNATRFTFYQQRVVGSGFVTLTARTRDGRSLHAQSTAGLAISEPIQVAVRDRIQIDQDLWKALCDLRSADADAFGRWQDAISAFNGANTDSDDISPQAEWVLITGAFERLLDAQSKARDVADQFEEAISPLAGITCADASRKADCKGDQTRSLRWAWMYEFYRLRNDYAHGKTDSAQLQSWNPTEHLILAAIACPLLLKVMLAKLGKYELTDLDEARIGSFEPLADLDDFFAEPPGMRGTGDSLYSRLVNNAKSARLDARFAKSLDVGGEEGS